MIKFIIRVLLIFHIIFVMSDFLFLYTELKINIINIYILKKWRSSFKKNFNIFFSFENNLHFVKDYQYILFLYNPLWETALWKIPSNRKQRQVKDGSRFLNCSDIDIKFLVDKCDRPRGFWKGEGQSNILIVKVWIVQNKKSKQNHALKIMSKAKYWSRSSI
jgi:hypothetical protein